MPLIQNPGRYAVKVQSAEFGESQTGTPFFQLSFQTEEGQHINGWLYLSEKALENSVKTLRSAFDFDGNFETAIDQVQGKECSIVVELEEYEGKDRIKVKWINSTRSVKPIDNQASFLKSLTAKAARIPAQSKPAAKPAQKKADEPF